MSEITTHEPVDGRLTSNYRWAYLCSSPRRLDITLRALPAEPLEGLERMFICWLSHLDPPLRDVELQTTLTAHAPAWLDWQVLDLSPQERALPERLRTLYWSTGKARWSLGVKLLFPLIFKTPYLYTDDDVLVTRDPQPLMGNSFGSKGCFRLKPNKNAVACQLFDAFGLPYAQPGGASPRERYNASALDAGVWFQKYPDDWEQQLEHFALAPYLADLTTRNLELRCLDQRFLTMFGLKHGWDPVTIGNGFAPPKAVTERMVTRHPFFHYKSQSKEKWMVLIERYLDLREAAESRS